MTWTTRFDAEADEHRLRWTCPDCVHYLASIRACAHEWPNRDHTPPADAGERASRELVFCKEFDLR
jgi:hypothetical protein